MKTLNCIILYFVTAIKRCHKMIQQVSKSECNLRQIIATMQLNRKMTFGKLKDRAQTMNSFAKTK